MKAPPVKGDVRESPHARRAQGRPPREPDPAFQDRLRKAIGERSVNSVARQCGFSEGLLRGYLNRGMRPGGENLVKLAATLEVRLDWLTTGAGHMRATGAVDAAFEERDLVQVPLYPIDLSAGPGRAIWPSGEPVGHFAVPLQAVRAARLPIAALVGFTVHGDSMQPDIRDGDVAIIDTSRTLLPPTGKGIYAIRRDDDLQLKRLAWDGETLVLTSDNAEEYPPEQLAPADAERIQVIGRLWAAFHRQPAVMQD